MRTCVRAFACVCVHLRTHMRAGWVSTVSGVSSPSYETSACAPSPAQPRLPLATGQRSTVLKCRHRCARAHMHTHAREHTHGDSPTWLNESITTRSAAPASSMIDVAISFDRCERSRVRVNGMLCRGHGYRPAGACSAPPERARTHARRHARNTHARMRHAHTRYKDTALLGRWWPSSPRNHR